MTHEEKQQFISRWGRYNDLTQDAIHEGRVYSRTNDFEINVILPMDLLVGAFVPGEDYDWQEKRITVVSIHPIAKHSRIYLMRLVPNAIKGS